MKTLYSNDVKPVDKVARNRSIFLFLLIVAAFILRINGIKSHPTYFHSARQYKVALLARSYFLNSNKHKDDIGRIPSIMFQNFNERVDPQINEKLIYQLYRIAGKEDLYLPRTMSVLFWLLGAIILYKISLLLFGGTGSLISVIFYLFFPFGINISQSVQSESLLNMFFLWGVLQIIKHFRSEKGEYFYSAALLSGFAVFIKLTIIFPLLGLIAFLGINKYGLKRYFLNWRTVWFFTIFLSVGVSFYVRNILWNNAMQELTVSIISPELLLTPFFWMGWFTQIAKVTGIAPFIIGLILFSIIRGKEVKLAIAGLFFGYVFFALIFSYTSATNDYYQLALFPIIALMLGQTGYLIDISKKKKLLKNVIVFSILIGGVIFSFYHQNKFMKSDHELRMYSPAFFFVGEQGSYFKDNIPEKNIWGNSFEAAETINHGINNILLSRSNGNAAMYYGKMFGRTWRTWEDIEKMKFRGKKILNAEDLYNSKYAWQNPKFFVITDFESWNKQPDLQKFLLSNFKLYREEKGYIIFNLRNKKYKFKKS